MCTWEMTSPVLFPYATIAVTSNPCKVLLPLCTSATTRARLIRLRVAKAVNPSALSPEAHAEWGLYKILEYMGLHEILPPGSGKNRAKLRKDIEEYHTAYAIDFDDADIGTFIARRPDGLAFDMEEKLCVFLEYTRTMDPK